MAVEQVTFEDGVVLGASDQGAGFYLNTFKRGPRLITLNAERTNAAFRHLNAFVTKTRSSTVSDLRLISPAWHGVSFYETDKTFILTHLQRIRTTADRLRDNERAETEKQRRLRKERYYQQRSLFHSQIQRRRQGATRLTAETANSIEQTSPNLKCMDARVRDDESVASLAQLDLFTKHLDDVLRQQADEAARFHMV